METPHPDYVHLTAERDKALVERDVARAELAELSSKMTIVLARLAELEAQGKRNSGNSHKPPSSDSPHQKPSRTNKPTGKSPGGREGHEGKTITPFSAEAVTPEPVVPPYCAHCGDDFAADVPCTSPPFLFQHIEVPAMPPFVLEYQFVADKILAPRPGSNLAPRRECSL